MKKTILLIGCLAILFTGCTEEEKAEAVTQVTDTLEAKLKEMNLEDEFKEMAEASIQKLEEAYVDEQKVMMDNAYKMGEEYVKLIAEQAEATFKEMSTSNTADTAVNQ